MYIVVSGDFAADYDESLANTMLPSFNRFLDLLRHESKIICNACCLTDFFYLSPDSHTCTLLTEFELITNYFDKACERHNICFKNATERAKYKSDLECTL